MAGIQTFPIQQLDYGAAVGEGQRLRQNDFILQEQQRKVQQQNALQQFYGQNGAAILAGDQSALGQYAGAAGPEAAIDLKSKLAGMDKSQLEATKSRTDIVIAGLNAVRNAGPKADKQALYDQVKKNIKQSYGIDIDAAGAPPQWDDAWADAKIASGQTLQQQLEQAQKGVAPNFQRVGGSQAQGNLEVAPVPGSDADPTYIERKTAAQNAGKPPETRNIIEGSNEYTGAYNPQTKKFEPIGKPGPRFSPNQGGAGAIGGRTLTERMQNQVLKGDPTTPEYAAAYANLAKPRIVFDPNTGETIQIAPDMSWARKPGTKAAPTDAMPSVQYDTGAGGGEGRPEVSRGPGRSASPTQATFQANLGQAQTDLKAAEDIYFPGGKFDRATAFVGSAGVPGTKGREGEQAIRRAIEIILRLRTGAAAPESEVQNYLRLFRPSALDSNEGAKTKMQRLKQFFEDSKGASSSKLPQAGEVSPAAADGWTVKKRAP